MADGCFKMVTAMNISDLIKHLNINKGAVVSVVGCGGKTTLVEKMAEALKEDYKVGVAASTKMLIPGRGTYSDIFIRSKRECIQTTEKPGIYYFADEIIPSKLSGFGGYMEALAKASMDMILVEADGSKSRPCKGWTSFEPVILDDTTLTIGVLTLDALGKPATDESVHRMREFEKLTGIKSGEIIRESHLCAMVNSDEGMFKQVKTRKVLLINKVESKEQYQRAINFIDNHILKVDEIYIGSIKNEFIEIYKKDDVKTAAVVLASGYGKRMGQNKLLMHIDGKPMIQYVLDNVEKNDFYERHIVTAYKEVENIAAAYGDFHTVINTHPEFGQSHSVVLGTKHCSAECDGYMFFTGDMPKLTCETVNKLLKVFAKEDKIVVPVYGSNPGNPVIFPKRFRKTLLDLTGDAGGRQIIKAFREQVVYVPVTDKKQGMDIDTHEDFMRLEAKSDED